MRTLLEQYALFYRRLTSLEKKLSDTQQQQNNAQQSRSANITKARAELEDRLKQNTTQTARVKAFIDIAQDRTTHRVPAPGPIPYNNGKLSRLAVQINTSLKNDPFAAQLYTEATGQLLYLQEERQKMEMENELYLKSLENNLSNSLASARQDALWAEVELRDFFKSRSFLDFMAQVDAEIKTFSGSDAASSLGQTPHGSVSIGLLRVPFPVHKNFWTHAFTATNGLFDSATCTIGIPVSLNILGGSVIIAEYDNYSERMILSGMQNIILNIARYYRRDFSQICFFDPIRYHSSSLGCFSELCGDSGALIDSVPDSQEALRNKVKSIITQINIREARAKSMSMQSKQSALYIFHNFPHAYDGQLVSQIQQLCVNAQHYGVTVILTNNTSSKSYTAADTLAFLRTFAITVSRDSVSTLAQNSGSGFDWYQAPSILPADLKTTLIAERPVVNLSNDYHERIGIPEFPDYRKGHRALENIPFGVDSEGVIKTLDFENSNFATFVCGASRSGKSTLLHTLLTGFIKNNHPDDIEIWLIDFKMTEFSRYINHLPPHIRYIILDESPELVYDILDRLTEIMLKRQNIFKGKWLKLKDVPESKYMPSILVVIDEFSVMSQIVADSVVNSRENYAVKLQMLLAKGAALGMHFIFASQGFTSGTRGLNDMSKKQVQQRIAMKTEFSEIKETLDLKSPSDEDKALMEHLPVHHAVTRIPADEHGNHLCLSQVLYISDYAKQEEMIDTLCRKMTPVPRFDPRNPLTYISKQPMIIDGNIYLSFAERQNQMQKYLTERYDILADGTESVLFIGEPRRMMPIFPIHIFNEFCENMLMVAPMSETAPAASVLMSIGTSLGMQGEDIEIWSSRKNPIYRQVKYDCRANYGERTDLAAICSEIKRLKHAIQNKVENRQFYVLIGFESILIDMSFQTGSGESVSIAKSGSTTQVEKRGADELDLNSLLAAITSGAMAPPVEEEPQPEPDPVPVFSASACYDAREDLKYILTNGPRLGYHFIMHFSSPGDVNQSKIDTALFKHKIMFRAPKSESSLLVGSGNASVVANLEDHSYRYTNGLESLSFRPYLHPGLAWDGWQLSGGDVVNMVDEEDEYLL